MIKIIITVFLFTLILPAQSFNVDLLGSLNPYPEKEYSSLWGYTADDGKEYALLGVEHGTSIIDITDPSQPVEVDFIPGPLAPPYNWREMKTHSHYAYIVSEGSGTGSGMQIVDLSYLPDSAVLVNTYNAVFTSAHNIYIDSGFAYIVGGSGGGMHILDLADQTNPVWKANYTASGYIHDVYVWNDTAYASSADTYDLIDLSNKSNPVLVSQSSALPGIYAHSGWLSEDKRYFFACEEFNQRDLTVWDLEDRTSWNLIVPQWQMPGSSPIHNIYIKNDYAHVAYYREGYIIFDISDPADPKLAGQYNTYNGTPGTYTGAWNCFPFFESGSVIVSDMQTGLYVLNFTLDDPTSVSTENNFPEDFIIYQNYPNPFNPSTNLSFVIGYPSFVNLKVYDILGNEVAELLNEYLTEGKYDIKFDARNLPSGIYFAGIKAGSFNKLVKMILLK